METNIELENIKVKKPALFGMILSPSVQFERMKGKTPIGLPLVLMLLLMAVSGGIISFLSANNPAVKDLYESTGIKIPIAVTIGSGALSALFAGAAMFFISAAFYKICMVFFGNDTPYMKLVAVVLYSSVISALGLIINELLALLLGSYEAAYTSLAPLVGDNLKLKAIAGSFDIFQIWYYVILAIGLNIVAGLSKNKAILLVVIVFLIGLGFSFLGSLFTPKVFS
jgi:hypothetical protein